jgi:hypothetical protein
VGADGLGQQAGEARLAGPRWALQERPPRPSDLACAWFCEKRTGLRGRP